MTKDNSYSGKQDNQSDVHLRDFDYTSWLSASVQACPSSHIGVAYHGLNVYGFNTPTDYQKTVGNYPLVCYTQILRLFGRYQKSRIDILRDFEGLMNCGEMVLVLGKPGSGCTTLLKTLVGQTHGFFVDPKSQLNYQGMLHLLI
jgi:ATP-binding cassette subfamily G (WHITE) protein 2 (PDR)